MVKAKMLNKMKISFIFLQSVSAHEWEVGEIMNDEINHNPEYMNCTSCVTYVKCFKDFTNIIDSLCKIKSSDYYIVQIVGHSNKEKLAFKDVRCNKFEDWEDEIEWTEVYDYLMHIDDNLKRRLLFVFITCYSASFFSSVNPPINIIASEGDVSSHRAEELLFKLYKEINNGYDFESAYNLMLKKYPLDEEYKREKEKMAILRYFKRYATSTT